MKQSLMLLRWTILKENKKKATGPQFPLRTMLVSRYKRQDKERKEDIGDLDLILKMTLEKP